MEATSAVEQFVLHAHRQRPEGTTSVIGICGSQGSGKSTLAKALKRKLEAGHRLGVAVVSLDDLYLPSRQRAHLAATVHPLLRTRGVPGTHDAAMGVRLIEGLKAAGPDDTTPLPRFDKARDEPADEPAWETFTGRPDIVLFEGWCVGARAQPPGDLAAAVNALEASEDADGRWRRHVNEQLAGPYRALFGLIDFLVLLAAPSFEVVYDWRRQQEHELARSVAPGQAGLMDDAAIRRFIMHYERITRHILAEMPGRADATLRLDEDRRIVAIERSGPGARASSLAGAHGP